MKKTLIFNGSPRSNGDTASLLKILTKNLDGEFKIVNCYKDKISPCVDCRKCREIDGCVIKDKMQEIYDYLIDCDNVVVATPIYFSQPTGEFLNVASRFQRYFSQSYFNKNKPNLKAKKGSIILVGGGNGEWEPALNTVKDIMKMINVKEYSQPVVSHNTDNTPAINDENAVKTLLETAEFLNK
ncbi:MAG: flavodoxin family protein [Oscillospiraceae bacterium]|nr:flavodoxin family protein [Oscillospiraceae bacterium]